MFTSTKCEVACSSLTVVLILVFIRFMERSIKDRMHLVLLTFGALVIIIVMYFFVVRSVLIIRQ